MAWELLNGLGFWLQSHGALSWAAACRSKCAAPLDFSLCSKLQHSVSEHAWEGQLLSSLHLASRVSCIWQQASVRDTIGHVQSFQPPAHCATNEVRTWDLHPCSEWYSWINRDRAVPHHCWIFSWRLDWSASAPQIGNMYCWGFNISVNQTI